MKIKTLALISFLALAACSKVPAGNVGVKAYLLGGDKGVDSEVVGPGRYWTGPNTELFIFPTYTQTRVWDAGNSIAFQDNQGLRIVAAVGVTYSIDKDKVSTLFQKYRRGIDEISDVYLRNMVRDAFVSEASRRPVEDIYSSGKDEMVAAVMEIVHKQMVGSGINVEKIYLVGEMELPEAVIEALNAKIAATQEAQRRENEVASATAEAAKTVAQAKGTAEARMINAQAEADANRIVAQSLTSELIQYRKVSRWDGKNPHIVTGGSSSILVQP